MADKRQRAFELIELALDDSTTEDERRSAAMQAVKHIDRHGLLDQVENETVRAVSTLVDKVMDPDVIDSAKKISSLFNRSDGGEGGSRRRRRRRR